jgi:hypothetical protein
MRVSNGTSTSHLAGSTVPGHESGVLALHTPETLFDREFPGMYLRLIRRISVSLIALVPPTRGIAATFGTAGASRVVVARDDEFRTVVLPRPPEMVALTVPINAPGAPRTRAATGPPRPVRGPRRRHAVAAGAATGGQPVRLLLHR